MNERAIFEQFMGVLVTAKQARRINPALRAAIDKLCDQEDYSEEWLSEVAAVMLAVVISLM